jgi:hypothetical protein
VLLDLQSLGSSEDPEVSARVHGRRAATTTRFIGGVCGFGFRCDLGEAGIHTALFLRIGQKSRGKID